MTLPSSLSRWPVLAVVALLLLGAAAILAVMLMAARGQDRLAATKSEATLEATLAARRHEMANLAHDYSFWSDAVENLAAHPSRDWADDNIGMYLYGQFRVATAFVVDPDDKATLVYVEGQRAEPDAVASVLPQLRPLLAAARAAAAAPWDADTGPAPASGFVIWQGTPTIAAAGALVPQDASPSPSWRHLLVMLRAIDDALLTDIAQSYGFEGLRWAQPTETGLPTLADLSGPDGVSVGRLTWKPETPGRALVRQMLPVILAAFAVMATLSAGLIAFIERSRAAHRRHLAVIEEQNEALHAAKERAEQLSRSKSEFLALISHELRTPLNAIIGFAELMRKEVRGPLGDPAYRDYATDIQVSGQQLLSLINDILDLSRIEAGKFELREERIGLGRVAEACIGLLRPQLEQKKLSIGIDGLAGLGRVQADERLMRQMLLNLLSNAIKFTPERGRIAIGGGPAADGGVEIAVSDTGIGMSAEEQRLALEPFVQVDSSLARRFEGSGLGLPITKRFIELHGGRLAIESRKGEGTTVTLWFPPGRRLEAARMVG
ncbi:MAG: ATP-binding protein [Pseudomonadota bacterium]